MLHEFCPCCVQSHTANHTKYDLPCIWLHLACARVQKCMQVWVCLCVHANSNTFRSCFTHIWNSFIFFLRTACDFPSRFLFWQWQRANFSTRSHSDSLSISSSLQKWVISCVEVSIWNITHKRISEHIGHNGYMHQCNDTNHHRVSISMNYENKNAGWPSESDWYRKMFATFISWARCMSRKMLYAICIKMKHAR